MDQVISFEKYKQNRKKEAIQQQGFSLTEAIEKATVNHILKALEKQVGGRPERGKREAIVPNGFDDFGGGLFK